MFKGDDNAEDKVAMLVNADDVKGIEDAEAEGEDKGSKLEEIEDEDKDDNDNDDDDDDDEEDAEEAIINLFIGKSCVLFKWFKPVLLLLASVDTILPLSIHESVFISLNLRLFC
jgi:ABC-type Zn2+ transport system substrate-binding protein/surface adhesin